LPQPDLDQELEEAQAPRSRRQRAPTEADASLGCQPRLSGDVRARFEVCTEVLVDRIRVARGRVDPRKPSLSGAIRIRSLWVDLPLCVTQGGVTCQAILSNAA